MVQVHAAVRASDNCGIATLDVALESVTSSELDDAPGSDDGDTINDIQFADIGTADTDIDLRAEAAASGPGRVYTMLYSATDAANHTAYYADHAFVPRDDSTWTDSVSLMMIATEAGTLAEWTDAAGGTVSLIRGNLHALRATGGAVGLGPVSCIEADSADSTTLGFEDTELPGSDRAFFYLVDHFNGTSRSLGTSSMGNLRAASFGTCN